MATVTMTLYEALAKKKILEDQVHNTKNYRMIDKKLTYSDTTPTGVQINEVKSAIQSAFSSSVSLLYNYIALKSAINDANASIQVEINGTSYSIANAIIRQRELDREEAMYSRMLSNVNILRDDVNKTNERYLSADEVSKYVSKILGDSKKDQTLIDSIVDKYKKEHQVELYDPLNTEELALNRLDEIKSFREQIHFVLTQANCNNKITVDFAD
jgi:hypothetical protein